MSLAKAAKSFWTFLSEVEKLPHDRHSHLGSSSSKKLFGKTESVLHLGHFRVERPDPNSVGSLHRSHPQRNSLFFERVVRLSWVLFIGEQYEMVSASPSAMSHFASRVAFSCESNTTLVLGE